MSRPVEYTTLRVNTHVNSGLQVIVKCQCTFINCNKCSTLVEIVGNGGCFTCVGQRVYGKPLYLLLKVAVYLKLL